MAFPVKTKETIMTITTKKVLKWIWSEFKREMVIQKQDPVMLARMQQSAPQQKQETRQERIFKNGINGFAMILLICVGVALLVF